MPRNISNSKKYLPALSNAPSPSSQRLGRGNRKPGGGGPAGVAARGKVVEKRATVAAVGRRPVAKCEGLRSVAAGRLRASMLNGFVLAILGAVGSQGEGCRCLGSDGKFESLTSVVTYGSTVIGWRIFDVNIDDRIGRRQ